MARVIARLISSDFLGGLNSNYADRRIADNEYRIFRNLELISRPLSARSRLGYTSINIAGNIATRRVIWSGIWRWDLITPTTQWLWVDGNQSLGSMNIDNGAGFDSFLSTTTGLTRPVFGAEARGNTWLIDSDSRLQYVDDLGNFFNAGIPVPANVGTVTGVAGALSGRFRYRLAFQSRTGTRLDGAGVTITSDFSPATEITLSAQNASFTVIPTSTDIRVTDRLLYRTKDLNIYPETYYLATTLADNTTTTYTDSTTDASLGAEATWTSGQRDRSPLAAAGAGAQIIAYFASKMWIWHSNQKEGWFSANLNPHYYDTSATGGNPVRISAKGNLRGVAVFQERQYVFFDQQIWALAGVDFTATGSGVVRKVLDVGTTFPRSIVVTPNEMFFLTTLGGQFSVIRLTGQDSEVISHGVADQFVRSADVNVTDNDEFWATYFNGKYMIVADADNKVVLVYDVAVKAWSQYTQYMDMLVADEGANRIVGVRHNSFTSPTTQRVYRCENGNVDFPENVSTAIPCRIRTKPFDGGLPDMRKELVWVVLDIQPGGGAVPAAGLAVTPLPVSLTFDGDALGTFEAGEHTFIVDGRQRFYDLLPDRVEKDKFAYALDLAWSADSAEDRISLNQLAVRLAIREDSRIPGGGLS